MHYALVIALTVFPFASVAQTVYKCIGDDEVMTFQDFPCSSDENEDLLIIKPNVLDASGLRANVAKQHAISAARAEQRAREREQRDEENRSRRERRDLITEIEARLASKLEAADRERGRLGVLDPSDRDHRDSAGLGFDRDRSRPGNLSNPPVPQAPEHPAIISSCDAGGCWDFSGNRYNGTGDTLFRDDGKICRQVGNQMFCH